MCASERGGCGVSEVRGEDVIVRVWCVLVRGSVVCASEGVWCVLVRVCGVC